MQNTPNFNFTIAEGTDTVNLLTQCYPNFTSLDSILQAIKESGVTTATATKTGTNFAVVRTDTDCNFFRFVATANYAAGDTFTVDGVPVTATSAAGTALASGAFVINQSVLCVLNSAVLTVFAGGAAGNIDAADVDYDNTVSGLTATDVQAAIDELKSDIPSIPATYDADDIVYDNTGSGLTATDVQAAIDEVVGLIPTGDYVEVTANGVKTYGVLLNELAAAMDFTKVKGSSYYEQIDNNNPNASGVYLPVFLNKDNNGRVVMTRAQIGSSGERIEAVDIQRNASSATEDNSGSITNKTNTVITSGQIFRFTY